MALKDILVALYGTTGSFWNRLANVDAFEEINRLSREILIKSKDIVQGLGYELLYADTDSVFLKVLSENILFQTKSRGPTWWDTHILH